MNSTYEPGLLSPLAQYLPDGGSQQTSMGTPRPGTPRGSHFRLSPDGNLNPGTPGTSSHDHHKVPNSPWSGSEPATPGSGYSRNGVVPNSPYISSYPNTPATPGGGGFYQKPCGIPASNGNCNNTTASVPPGSSSPWTDRSVCTPGPMTPLTPATPMHSSAMSEHGGSSFGNNGSPTFPSDSSSNGSSSNGNCGKSMHNAPSLAALLQEVPTDSLLPVPVMNHSVQQTTQQQHQPQQTPQHHQIQLQPPPSSQQQQNGSSVNANIALPPSLPNISERDINQAVDTNPNLITEFEQFFADYMNSRKNEESAKQRLQNNPNPIQNQNRQQPPPPQHQQPQQQQQQQPPQSHPQQQQLMNTMNPMNMNGNPNGMMYQNNGMAQNPNNQGPPGSMMMNMNNGGHQGPNHMMNNGMYMVGGPGGPGPMRTNKFIGQPHQHGGHSGQQHPYMAMGSNNGGAGNGNGLMMRARQIPNGHLHPQHSNQYGGPGPQSMPPQQHHPQQHQHPHPSQQTMLGQMQGGNRPGNQFSLHHQQASASVYAPPPSGNNGGYVQIQQQQQQQQQGPPQHNVPPPNYQNVQSHHPPHPQQNTGPVHWQNNGQQQQQQPQPNQHSQSLNNHGMMSNGGGQNGMMNGGGGGPNGMMSTNGQNGMMPNRVMPPQSQLQQQQQQQQPSSQQPPNPYFQNNAVNQVGSNQDQGGLSNVGGGGGGSVLPQTSYPFDLNSGSGPGSVNSLPMTPGGGGTSAMQTGPPLTPQQVPVQSPMSIGMGMPSTPQPNTPHMVGPVEDVILDLDGPYDGSTINQAQWTKAADKAGRANAVCEVGKVLFDEIFTDDEVIYCTLSGRGSTKKFNQNKVVYLKKATAWLMTRPARPWEFNVATCGDISLNQEDESGVRGVEKKVFTEYRSRRRSDILKARSQTGGPPSVSSVS